MTRLSKVILAVIIFLCVAGAAAFIFTRDSSTLVISGGGATGTSTVKGNSVSTPPAPMLAPLNTSTYNAKLLEIANLPVITKTFAVTSTIPGTSSTIYKTVTTTSTAPSRWPMKTAYPDAGAILPFNRIVAYYGNFYSTAMGVLGEYPKPQVLAMLASTSAEWAAADPSTPVIEAVDYIAVAAQASAGPDGKYRLRMPASQVDQAISMAQQVNGLAFLDIQVGLSNVETEVPLLEQYLKLPDVELSLDPEFDMHNGARPGTVIGTMDASDINFAAQYLAGLVKQYNLPPKILVVHRFTDAMVTNTDEIQPLPQVQIVMDMDGFGSQARKINTYKEAIVDQPVQFTGFKLFYKNDNLGSSTMMTPAEVLKLSPQPSYIQYE